VAHDIEEKHSHPVDCAHAAAGMAAAGRVGHTQDVNAQFAGDVPQAFGLLLGKLVLATNLLSNLPCAGERTEYYQMDFKRQACKEKCYFL